MYVGLGTPGLLGALLVSHARSRDLRSSDFFLHHRKMHPALAETARYESDLTRHVIATAHMEEGVLTVEPVPEYPALAVLAMQWTGYGEKRVLEIGLIREIIDRLRDYTAYGVPYGPHHANDLRPAIVFDHDRAVRGTSPNGEIRFLRVNDEAWLAVQVPDRALVILGPIYFSYHRGSAGEAWMSAQSMTQGVRPATVLFQGEVVPFQACAYHGYFGRALVGSGLGVYIKVKDELTLQVDLGVYSDLASLVFFPLGEVSTAQARGGQVWTLRPAEVARARTLQDTSYRLASFEKAAASPDELTAICQAIDKVAAVPGADARARDRTGIDAVASLLKALAHGEVSVAKGRSGPLFRAELFRKAQLPCAQSDRTLRYGFAHFAAYSTFVRIEGHTCTLTLRQPPLSRGAGGTGLASTPTGEFGSTSHPGPEAGSAAEVEPVEVRCAADDAGRGEFAERRVEEDPAVANDNLDGEAELDADVGEAEARRIAEGGLVPGARRAMSTRTILDLPR